MDWKKKLTHDHQLTCSHYHLMFVPSIEQSVCSMDRWSTSSNDEQVNNIVHNASDSVCKASHSSLIEKKRNKKSFNHCYSYRSVQFQTVLLSLLNSPIGEYQYTSKFESIIMIKIDTTRLSYFMHRTTETSKNADHFSVEFTRVGLTTDNKCSEMK